MFRWIKYALYAFVGIGLGGLAFEAVTFPRVASLRDVNPSSTSMIEARAREARNNGAVPQRVQIWVPLEKISPNLQRAVLAGEDTNFASHHGFDYEAIQRAWDQAQKEADKEAKQEGDQDSWIPDYPAAGQEPLPVERTLVYAQGSGSDHYLLSRGRVDEASHSRTLSERHRMGRRNLRRRSSVAILLSQACGKPQCS